MKVFRIEQIKDFYSKHVFFPTNAMDIETQKEFIHEHLLSQWQIYPKYEGKLGLKQAIREGKVFNTSGSVMDIKPGDLEETTLARDELVKGLITAGNKLDRDMDMSMQLDDDPTSISVERWHQLMDGDPSPMLKQSLNRCSQELGIKEE